MLYFCHGSLQWFYILYLAQLAVCTGTAGWGAGGWASWWGSWLNYLPGSKQFGTRSIFSLLYPSRYEICSGMNFSELKLK
jgi:hypothetical protein